MEWLRKQGGNWSIAEIVLILARESKAPELAYLKPLEEKRGALEADVESQESKEDVEELSWHG